MLTTVSGFRHPAFISYSSLDNQRWAQWLNQFRDVFEQALAAELAVEGINSGPMFFDVDALDGKTNSVSANLKEAIDSSFALFIFLGKGYLASEWCFEELKMFSGRVGSARDILNKRVWIFELEALDEFQKSRFEKRLKDANASVLSNQRTQVFVDPKTRMRPVLKLSDGEIDNKVFQEKVEPLVKELVSTIRESSFVRQPFIRKLDVLIAACTSDLEAPCTELVSRIKETGHTCERVSAQDLDELDDEALQARFAASRVVVVPLSEAKVYMRKATGGGHLAMQLKALRTLEHGRMVAWQPMDGRLLDASEREWEERHLPTVNELLARAKLRKSVSEIFQTIEPAIDAPDASPSAEVTVLCETRDDANLIDDDVIAEISRRWKPLSPELIRDAHVAYLKLDVDTLCRSRRSVNGDAVIVFRDESDELTNRKCRTIARYMETWQRSLVPVQAGLIVERDESDTMIVHCWPKARFAPKQSGDPPRTIGAFLEKSQGSLQRFLRSIAELKAPPADVPQQGL